MNGASAVASRGRLSLALLSALTLCSMFAAPARAVGQGAADSVARFVSGKVLRPGAKEMRPVAGVWVTLHRVGPDSSGPLDSARTLRDGGYSFRYRSSGNAQAIYFLSVSYGGVAYFSAPLRDERVTGDDAEITVFDTTSAPIPLHLQGRHIVVSSPNSAGLREIVEVYEVSNDTTVTRISPDDAHPTWRAILPAAAEGFQVAQADISPSSIRSDSGLVTTVAPFAPGLKQISFSYELPESAFPLEVPLTDSVPVLEVLLEEPAAKVSGARLAQVAAATIEGRTFNRFLAQSAPKNAVVTIVAPPPGTPPLAERFLVVLVAVIIFVMSVAFALYYRRRRAPVAARAVDWSPPPTSESAEAARIARDIAALDEAHERDGAGGAAADDAYRTRREELKRALAAELAGPREHAADE